MNVTRHSLLIAIWLILASGLPVVHCAQHEKPRAKSKVPCDGGVLNGKVITEARPTYPEKAKKEKAQGTVIVRVRVDEEGKIYEATPCLGHPLLQQSSITAAKRTLLSPTVLSGKPVKVAGVLVYLFELGYRSVGPGRKTRRHDVLYPRTTLST
jgi:TonB family protein